MRKLYREALAGDAQAALSYVHALHRTDAAPKDLLLTFDVAPGCTLAYNGEPSFPLHLQVTNRVHRKITVEVKG